MKLLNNKGNSSIDYKDDIKIVFFMNFIFSIIEVIGGLLTHSISILSDSLHNLGDSITIGINYFFDMKKLNKDFYSNLRYTLIGSLIASFILLVGSVIIIYNAIPRLINPISVNYDAMIIFGIFGLLINIYAFINVRKNKNKNFTLHMIEDSIIWLFILLGSIGIKVTGYIIIDPLLSLLIAIYVLYQIYRYMKKVYNIFTDKIPKSINKDDIKKYLIDKDIVDVFIEYIWTLDNINYNIAMKIILKNNVKIDETQTIKNDINDKLKKYNINNSIIEIIYSVNKN